VAADKGSKSLLPVALAVVPYTLASLAAYAVAHSAQRRNEHFFHVSLCLLLSGTVLALFPVMAGASVAGGFASLTLSLAMGAAANGPATALVARLCKGPEQVGRCYKKTSSARDFLGLPESTISQGLDYLAMSSGN
jgi:hypothetical protein